MEIEAVIVEALNSMERAVSLSPPKGDVEVSALRWELYASLQNFLEALAMLVSDLRLKRPSSYAELGTVLYEAGLIDEETLENIKLIAATRNVLARAYRRLSPRDLKDIVRSVKPKLESAARVVRGIVKGKRANLMLTPPLDIGKVARVFEGNNIIIAYLFGSRARGSWGEDSDYDIAVLFGRPDVSVIGEVKLAVEIARELKVPPDRVDVVALDKADTMLKVRVLREGIPIYEKSGEFRVKWERREYLEILRQTDLHAIYINSRLQRSEKLGQLGVREDRG